MIKYIVILPRLIPGSLQFKASDHETFLAKKEMVFYLRIERCAKNADCFVRVNQK